MTEPPERMACVSRRRGGVGAVRRLAVAMLGTLLLWGLSASPAAAHPSDFDTLTVDLLVGSRGLWAIDAAVVVSDQPPYETVETDVRADVARQVLAALQAPTESAEINAEDSERYHWVGFVIGFADPALGVTTPIEIDTSQLQALTADLGLAYLKISVCGVSDTPEYSQPSREAFGGLVVSASEEGRRPTGFDREVCEVWLLQPDDEAPTIAVQPAMLPATGTALTWIVTLSSVLVGCGLVLLKARLPRQSPAARLRP